MNELLALTPVNVVVVFEAAYWLLIPVVPYVAPVVNPPVVPIAPVP